jgi:hypothetical protein
VLIGEIDPPVPALAVTVYFLSLNVALTAQAAVMEPVVYVVPLNVPPHPVTSATSYPSFRDMENDVVLPETTEALEGEIDPPLPAVAVTV